ncbi:MAG: hypothetical protein ACREWE_03840 [Gammaproteobacteria bacterium]
MKPKHAFEGSPAMAARVRIYFAYSQSLAYREAMELCRGIPSFTSTGEGNEVVHSIDVPITDIAVLMRLSELVGGWKSFRITIDGGEARRDDLIRLGGECYSKRQASEGPEQYCFGANRLEYNLWGCRRLDMPIDEAGHGWMAYGGLDVQGVWHFDKPRISQALESAMAGCRLCPVFDHARVQKTLDGLPETVDPRRDEHWRYRSGTRTQEGGGPRSAGIAPVAARIEEYVVGGFRPQWDFTRDWSDSKTEIFLGAVDRWSPSEAPDDDRQPVVIDREEVVKSRAGAARPQPGRPETEPPARWPRVAAVALCMFALCMLGLGVFLV